MDTTPDTTPEPDDTPSAEPMTTSRAGRSWKRIAAGVGALTLALGIGVGAGLAIAHGTDDGGPFHHGGRGDMQSERMHDGDHDGDMQGGHMQP